MWYLYVMYGTTVIVLAAVLAVAWRSARRVRRDIFKLAGQEEEKDEATG